MLFNKNKKPDMIDIRELQKRGVVRIPKSEIKVPTNNDGFVEMGNIKTPTTDSKSQTPNSPQSNTDFFGFTNTVTPTTDTKQPTTSFNDSSNGYDKREVDQKITELDNKIYKLEQRLELLEKKLDVNQSSNPAVGAMGW